MITYLMEISLGVTVGTLKLDLSQKMAAWGTGSCCCLLSISSKQKITDLPQADFIRNIFTRISFMICLMPDYLFKKLINYI